MSDYTYYYWTQALEDMDTIQNLPIQCESREDGLPKLLARFKNIGSANVGVLSRVPTEAVEPGGSTISLPHEYLETLQRNYIGDVVHKSLEEDGTWSTKKMYAKEITPESIFLNQSIVPNEWGFDVD